jgi:hypothetical protein
VQASFTPYSVRSVARHGGSTTYTLECLSARCAPTPGGARQVELPSAVVSVPGSRPVAIAWPPLRVASRLTPAEAAKPTFRTDLTPPRTSSRLDPGALGWTLTSLAGLLVVGSVLWTALALWPRRLRRTADDDLSSLERALGLVARSLDGPAEKRRAALDELAVVLGDDPFAGLVRTLAWSPQPPPAPAVEQVADEVRETAS